MELGFVPSAFLEEDESFGPVQSLSESGVRKAFKRVCSHLSVACKVQLLNRFLCAGKGKAHRPPGVCQGDVLRQANKRAQREPEPSAGGSVGGDVERQRLEGRPDEWSSGGASRADVGL